MRKIAVGIVLLVAACGGGSHPSASHPSASSNSSVPSCSQVIVAGRPLTMNTLTKGCDETDGTFLNLPAFVCIGGGELASVTFSGGHFWGLTGSTWHRVASVDTDGAYKTAYRRCTG